ncbi:hypothetical protein ACCO45_009703, partial [Purpureocillium lilacinum]
AWCPPALPANRRAPPVRALEHDGPTARWKQHSPEVRPAGAAAAQPQNSASTCSGGCLRSLQALAHTPNPPSKPRGTARRATSPKQQRRPWLTGSQSHQAQNGQPSIVHPHRKPQLRLDSRSTQRTLAANAQTLRLGVLQPARASPRSSPPVSTVAALAVVVTPHHLARRAVAAVVARFSPSRHLSIASSID